MTFAEIKALHDMGFSADQIVSLTTSAGNPSPADEVPAVTPTADITPASDQAGVTPSAETPDGDAISTNAGVEAPISPTPATVENKPNPEISALMNEVRELRQIIQTNNIRDRTFDIPPVPEVDPEKILAEFIRPTFPERGV